MIPRRFHGAAVLCIALVIQLTAPRVVEQLRLRLAHTLGLPLRLAPSGFEGDFVCPEAAVALGRRIDRRLEERARAGHPGSRAFRVLDFDRRRSRLLLAGGRRQGVELGARVSSGGSCVGQVDRVEANLSRVQLLRHPDSRLAARCTPSLVREGEQEIEVFGVLLGEDGEARLTEAFLAERLRPGDEIRTLGQGVSGASLLVGTVSEAGLEPLVKLSGDAAKAAWLSVEVRGKSEGADLFESRPVRLIGARSGRFTGALLQASGGVEKGCAFARGSLYLGLASSTSARVVQARGPHEPGGELSVRVIVQDRSWSGTLGPDPEGGCRILSWHDGVPPDGPAVVFTAGGQSLVPSSLYVGEGEVEAGRLSVARPEGWPRDAGVLIFRHGEERRRLLGRRR